MSYTTQDLEKIYASAGIHNVGSFLYNLSLRINSGEDINIKELLIFENRISNLEKKIGFKLPQDYIEFLKEHSGDFAGYGEWFAIECIELANQFDIINYNIIEEFPEIISESDLSYMIPIYFDDGYYVVMDLRNDETSKGVFVIWHDEDNIEFQSKSFTEFKINAEKYAKESLENGRELVECDFFNFDSLED